jgi:hypothetical protein
VEKYGKARQATDDNITRRMRFTCWITKATDTHSEYVIPIAFPQQLVTRTRLNVTLYVRCLSCLPFLQANVLTLLFHKAYSIHPSAIRRAFVLDTDSVGHAG